MEEQQSLDVAQQAGAVGDMDTEAFRRYGHQVVDWMADYLANAVLKLWKISSLMLIALSCPALLTGTHQDF
ncbi:MAG: hypothetical protein E6I80_26145 [Chloroflexi bacterium]|nr:MAG: hypothetical protein E6I80_26145 [Chloroflexota bacterium]